MTQTHTTRNGKETFQLQSDGSHSKDWFCAECSMEYHGTPEKCSRCQERICINCAEAGHVCLYGHSVIR